eukprot:4889362-Pyramimonas_sp.AAC.1
MQLCGNKAGGECGARFLIVYTTVIVLLLVWTWGRYGLERMQHSPVGAEDLAEDILPGLAEVAASFETDKVRVHNYHRFYDRTFAPFQALPVRLLEI